MSRMRAIWTVESKRRQLAGFIGTRVYKGQTRLSRGARLMIKEMRRGRNRSQASESSDGGFPQPDRGRDWLLVRMTVTHDLLESSISVVVCSAQMRDSAGS